jgi:hypothetical protein
MKRNQALEPRIYFSDFFGVLPEVVDEYGAFNISLINDLPLFIDPFLLFDSEDKKYAALHEGIIRYLKFLRDRAIADELTEGNISHWFLFREVKQNWLGLSKTGNSGTGLGSDFALSLSKNLKTVFKDFGNETLTTGSHLEKLSLLNGGVGRDHLSDFATNLIKGFLLEYTQTFAKQYLTEHQRRRFHIDKVTFDYQLRRWKSTSFDLPYCNGDFVILTPKEILTRDDAWINQGDLLDQFTQIRTALPDDALRAQVNDHFLSRLNEKSTDKERRAAALSTIEQFHELLDYYIQKKESEAPQAHTVSDEKVRATHRQFVENVRTLVSEYLADSDFYEHGDSYQESLKRVAYLKHVIEDNDGYRVFYIDGKPIKRESDLQTMFRLTWYATSFDVNSEVNNGRGPVDYKVSKGRRNKSLVEFKLATNTGLRRNLENQVEIYQQANYTSKSIKVILYFSDSEFAKVSKILRELKLDGREDVVLIDASLETKVSASKA